MRRRFAPDTATMMLMAGLAVTAGVPAFLGLSAIARPHALKARLASVSAQAEQAQAITTGSGDPSAYDRGAACAGSPDAAERDLRRRIQAAAAAANLAAPRVETLTHSVDAELGAPNVAVQIQASGRYDAVLLMLDKLAASQPEVFVETLELQPRVSEVSFKLNGHLICRPPVQS